MALMAIDQGNSRTKFGIFHHGVLQQAWSVPTDKTAIAADLQAACAAHLLPDQLSIGLCTVVPEAVPQWKALAVEHGYELTVITGSTPTPLRNDYETPETLGPDRLMMSVAAAHHAGTPVIPVSLGTAIVVDAVSRDGAYLGGMIAPGIEVIARALPAAASALWPVDWQEPAAPIGRTSQAAMTSGLFYESLGGLRAMIDATRLQLGETAPLALTGGWAAKLAPYLDHVALVEDHLVLLGIVLTLQPPVSRSKSCS